MFKLGIGTTRHPVFDIQQMFICYQWCTWSIVQLDFSWLHADFIVFLFERLNTNTLESELLKYVAYTERAGARERENKSNKKEKKHEKKNAHIEKRYSHPPTLSSPFACVFARSFAHSLARMLACILSRFSPRSHSLERSTKMLHASMLYTKIKKDKLD